MLLFLLYFLIHTPSTWDCCSQKKKRCGASKAGRAIFGAVLKCCLVILWKMKKIHLHTSPNSSSHTHFPKTKQTFWASSFKDCRQSINDLDKNRGFFLLEKDKCELIFTTKWLVLYFSSTTYRRSPDDGNGSHLTFEDVSITTAPKTSELISSLPKTRAIRAISFWDALQMHSYKANSTCFVLGISHGASLILALKKLCNTRVAKNSFTVTVNSFKESNLQKSATVKPVKECTRQKLLDIIPPRFLLHWSSFQKQI